MHNMVEVFKMNAEQISSNILQSELEKGGFAMNALQIKEQILKRPFLYASIFIAVGSLSTCAYLSSTIPVYKCKTKTIDGQTWCKKYDTTFNPDRYVNVKFLGSCPNKPPSNCPDL